MRAFKIPSFVVNDKYAFHHSMLESVALDFSKKLSGFTFSDPEIKIISNYNNKYLTKQNVQESLTNQINHKIDFQANVMTALENCDAFVDVN
jgi:acyl transferase domain-containing protein